MPPSVEQPLWHLTYFWSLNGGNECFFFLKGKLKLFLADIQDKENALLLTLLHVSNGVKTATLQLQICVTFMIHVPRKKTNPHTHVVLKCRALWQRVCLPLMKSVPNPQRRAYRQKEQHSREAFKSQQEKDGISPTTR